MLDLEALIEPGRGLGGIEIGTAVDDLLAHEEPVRVVDIPGDEDDPDGVTIHSFGAIRTWSVKGDIVQVGAFDGYLGKTAEGIGIGSTVNDLREVYDLVKPSGAEGMIALPSTPGIGIETSNPDDALALDARIVQIFVHPTD